MDICRQSGVGPVFGSGPSARLPSLANLGPIRNFRHTLQAKSPFRAGPYFAPGSAEFLDGRAGPGWTGLQHPISLDDPDRRKLTFVTRYDAVNSQPCNVFVVFS